MSDLITLTDAEPTTPVGHRPGVSKRSLVNTPGLKVDEIFFTAGVETEDHGHAVEQAAYHVSGSFEIVIDGTTSTLSAGDAYSIPANEPHSVRCTADGSYVLVTVVGAQGDGHGDHHGGTADQANDHGHDDHGHDDHRHGTGRGH